MGFFKVLGVYITSKKKKINNKNGQETWKTHIHTPRRQEPMCHPWCREEWPARLMKPYVPDGVTTATDGYTHRRQRRRWRRDIAGTRTHARILRRPAVGHRRRLGTTCADQPGSWGSFPIPFPDHPLQGCRDTIFSLNTRVTRPYLHARMVVHDRLDGGGSGGRGPLQRVRGFHTTIPWYQSVVYNCSTTAACKSSDGSVRHETTCKPSSNTGTNIASNTKKMTVRVRQSSRRKERERKKEKESERVREWVSKWVRERATGDGKCVRWRGRRCGRE